MNIFLRVDKQVKSQHVDADADDTKSDGASIKFSSLSPPPSTFQNGSAFHITGDFQDPIEVVQHSCDFDSIIMILQQLKCAEDDSVKFYPESEITPQQREKIIQRDAEVAKFRESMEATLEENAKMNIEQECCEMLKSIGPPWNWLHNFASQNCHYKSYNFLETESVHSGVTQKHDFDDVEIMVKIIFKI